MMLKHGLNIKKKGPEKRETPSAKRPISAFAEDDSDDEVVGNKTKAAPNVANSSVRKFEVNPDDSIYDYDEFYDAMKSGDREAAKLKEQDKKQRKPKYMENLFEMAELRKKDRLRAEDVKLQREREAEGDEFADKEKFVTSAYREQQALLKKAEAEEAEREAELRAKVGGFSAFNQNVLEGQRKKHDQAVAASLSAVRHATSEDEPIQSLSESMAMQIKEAEQKLGHKIALNDDNQIVDHRQLLQAGLNRSHKPTEHLQTANLVKREFASAHVDNRAERRAQIERQQRMIEEQLVATRKREAEEALQKEVAIKMQAKRTKTESDITSAKERYLARKKAEAAAKLATAQPTDP